MVDLRLLLFVIIAGGLFIGLGACQQPSTSDVDQTEEGVLRLGSVEAVDTLSRGVDPSGRPLVIDGFRGKIEFVGGDESTADLEFIRRGRGKSAEAARGVLSDVTISESGSQEAYTYTLETDGASYAAVDLTGTVPRNTELRIEQSKGPVSISDVRGPITVSHEHGAVTIRDAGASVDVQIKNGDVAVDFRDLPSEATVDVQTRNGDVSVGLPPAAAAQLRAETNVGVIRTKGLSLADERFMPRDAGGRYTAQLGAGDASVELKTENGSVLVHSADMEVDSPTPGPAGQPDERAVPPSDTTVLPPPAPGTSRIDTTRPDTGQS